MALEEDFHIFGRNVKREEGNSALGDVVERRAEVLGLLLGCWCWGWG